MELFNQNILLYLATYLVSGIPFGYLLAKQFANVDIKSAGSGNIGATNVLRVVKEKDPKLAKKLGAATLLLDAFKGMLFIWIAKMLGAPEGVQWTLAVLAVVGHCFSIFLLFKGGKGVATAAGVFLALCPKTVAVAAVVFFIVLRMFGYVSAASLAAATSIPVLMHVFCSNDILESMSWTICLIIWLKHSDNLKRLSKGEEKRISFQSQGT